MAKRGEKTILFLCTGNYYRSRFAEVLFNSVAGKMGLPWPGTLFSRDIWYRFTSSSEGRKYEVIGKGIAKIEHYEDIIFLALESEIAKPEDKIKTVKFDDCLEMLRILHERQPDNPRNVLARIRFHAVEAKAAEDKQDWERGFVALMEERALHSLVPANAKLPEWIRITVGTPEENRLARGRRSRH